jgi:hypothetical protein
MKECELIVCQILRNFLTLQIIEQADHLRKKKMLSAMVLGSKNGELVYKRQSIDEEASSGTKLLIVHTFEIDAVEDSYFCSSG